MKKVTKKVVGKEVGEKVEIKGESCVITKRLGKDTYMAVNEEKLWSYFGYQSEKTIEDIEMGNIEEPRIIKILIRSMREQRSPKGKYSPEFKIRIVNKRKSDKEIIKELQDKQRKLRDEMRKIEFTLMTGHGLYNEYPEEETVEIVK